MLLGAPGRGPRAPPGRDAAVQDEAAGHRPHPGRGAGAADGAIIIIIIIIMSDHIISNCSI